jgi:hypothetical protein
MIQTFNIFISWCHGEHGGSGEDYQFTVRGEEEYVDYLVEELNANYSDFYSTSAGHDMYVYHPCSTVVSIVGLSPSDLVMKARELVK